MSSKVPTPVSGGNDSENMPDGFSDPGGRGAGGESGGGNYRGVQEDGDGDRPGLGYHGGDDAGPETEDSPNDMVRDGGDWAATGETGPKPGPTGPDQDTAAEYPREITADGRHIEVIDTSGIAAAEATGMTGVEGMEATDAEHPGSG
ncbi:MULTISPECIES: hypothetical protein [unclassified Sphingomonas]|uniref:hypothetical protein n=1 Tax=unclassified Sphingomonas TaxID=196159 RepID=UPI001F5727F3|nr:MULTISPECIES: hypothetical protein [unclassified Sphingomonas]